MKEEVIIKSPVNTELLDKVEQESYRMLYRQRVSYNERWYNSSFFIKGNSVLRLAGLIVSILGTILSVFYLVVPSACPKWYLAEIYLVFFVVVGVFLYYLPRLEAGMLARLKKAGRQGCKRMARRMVAKARKRVPFVAQYTIKGDLITYFRGQDDNWQQLWNRRLKGYALVNEHATLFFRKSTSIQPTMLVMYEQNEEMTSVLNDLEIKHNVITG